MAYSQNSNVDSSNSKASSRKFSKPLLERSRRRRINDQLEELRSLLTGDFITQDEEMGTPRVEKTKILSVAVQKLKELEASKIKDALSHDPDLWIHYYEGFLECSRAADGYLEAAEFSHTGDNVRSRLSRHLDSCLQSTQTTFTERQSDPTTWLQSNNCDSRLNNNFGLDPRTDKTTLKGSEFKDRMKNIEKYSKTFPIPDKFRPPSHHKIQKEESVNEYYEQSNKTSLHISKPLLNNRRHNAGLHTHDISSVTNAMTSSGLTNQPWRPW